MRAHTHIYIYVLKYIHTCRLIYAYIYIYEVCAGAQTSSSGVTQPKITKYDRYTTAIVTTMQMTELVVNTPVVHRSFKLMNRVI